MSEKIIQAPHNEKSRAEWDRIFGKKQPCEHKWLVCEMDIGAIRECSLCDITEYYDEVDDEWRK